MISRDVAADTNPSSRELKKFLGIITPCINANDNKILLLQVSNEEFPDVNSIGPLKAPKPDGVHAIIYQKYWDEVKQVKIPLIKDFTSIII